MIDMSQNSILKTQNYSIRALNSASLITRNTTDVTTIQTFMTQLFGIGLLAPVTAVVA